jgi:ribosomal protein S6--L-glutamate ligase
VKIAVLGNEGSWYVEALQSAATRRGHECLCLDFRCLTAAIRDRFTRVHSQTHPLHALDALIVRTMPPGSLEQVVFRMDVLQRVQEQGTHVLNSPKAIEAAVDKFLTTSRLADAGLPTPVTIVCESAEAALEAFEQLGSDVVVKPIFGSEGRGILRVCDRDLAERVFPTLERVQSVLYLQQFISHPGFDIRILMLDGQVLGSVRRRNPGDFRTNVARNGTAEPYTPTAREIGLAERAAAAVGACFAGVDLLYDSEGTCFVIEVNAVPGWRALQRATGIGVADRIIESLEKHENARGID